MGFKVIFQPMESTTQSSLASVIYPTQPIKIAQLHSAQLYFVTSTFEKNSSSSHLAVVGRIYCIF